MAVITRYRVQLTGFVGAPGVNTHYALDAGELAPSQANADDYADLLMAFYNTVKSYLANSMVATIVPIAELLDVDTGNLVGALPVSATPVTSTAIGTTLMSRATQIKVRATSDRIIGNRFLRGGIYLGPAHSSALDTAGQVKAEVGTAVATGYAGMLDVAGMRAALYSQPNPGRPLNPQGQFGYIQNVSVAPRPAVMRSRRD